MDAVSVSHLSKIYPGGTEALGDVSFTIGRGRVFCLLGRNGAGKTTLLRILATQLRPSAGTATVLGHDVVSEANAVRERIALGPVRGATSDDDISLRSYFLQMSDFGKIEVGRTFENKRDT